MRRPAAAKTVETPLKKRSFLCWILSLSRSAERAVDIARNIMPGEGVEPT